MFKFGAHKPARLRMDLQTVRETLIYIESDCRDQPGLQRLSAALAQTISEIDRVTPAIEPSPRADVVSARFLPADL